jgi:hypothetical protein
MRFMSIYRAPESNTPPTPEDYQRMGGFVEKMTKSGVLIATGGCLPSALGARVRSTKGKMSVTDGPFIESKEVIAGFAILECRSKEHAIECSKEFLAFVGGDGESEVRQMEMAPGCG